MNRSVRRTLGAGALVAVTAVALLVAGGALGRTPRPMPATSTVEELSPESRLDQAIARAQDRLRRVPGDWRTWAALGMAYLEHARVSADPTYYPKAEAAVRRSLAAQPHDNVDALVAQGALANARHDFAAARQLAERAVAANPYDADAYAVLVDALTQLGDQPAATATVQHLLDLRPGLSAYARASYDLELRGRGEQAAELMRRALADAVDRADTAFCRGQLGDLALASGDLAGAEREYRAGLAADPTSIALQRGMARVEAASGRVEAAISGYAALTRRAPTPGYLLEYADLLRANGREQEARAQLRLADAAQGLFTASGGIDGLTGAALAGADGDPAAALAQARQEWARRQHPDVADAYAWALHLSHQDSAAVPVMRRALAGGARPAGYLYHLGMIELGLGQRMAARTHLAEALRASATFSPLGVAEARRVLATLGS